MYSCKTCNFKDQSASKVLSHLKNHFLTINAEIECIEELCNKKFISASGLITHFYRVHGSLKKPRLSRSFTELDASKDTNDLFVQYDTQGCMESSDVKDKDSQLANDYKDFLLNFFADKHVTGTNIQHMNENLIEIGDTMKKNCIDLVQNILQKHKVPNFTAQSVISEIKYSNSFNVFAQPQFKNQNSRAKEFKKSLFYVAPKEIILNSKETRSGKSINQSAFYIPIKKTIQNIFKVAKKEYFESNKKTSDYINDYTDGIYFKKNKLFQLYPKALRLEIFIDDYCVTDPLKPGKGKHKMSGMYLRIGNFPNFFGSRKDRLQLVMLVNKILIKQYGMRRVFHQFLQDLMELENGWSFDGISEVVYGTVVYFRTDSLGKS